VSRLWSWLAGRPRPLRLLVFAAAVALVLVEASLESTGGGGGFTRKYLLNLLHAPLYGFLGAAVLLLGGVGAPRRAAMVMLALGLVLAAGFLDEWHQAGLPGRTSSLQDLGTDLLGACLAWLLAREAAAGPEGLGWGHLLGLGTALLLLWGLVPALTEALPLPFLRP